MWENAACMLTGGQWTVAVAQKPASVDPSHVNLANTGNEMFSSIGMAIVKCLLLGVSDTFACSTPVFALTLGQPFSSGHRNPKRTQKDFGKPVKNAGVEQWPLS